MPELTPVPAELRRIYEQRFETKTTYRNAVWQVLTDSFFQRWIPTGGAVLDLGCGYGEFINNIRAEKKYAMDLNPDASSHLAKGIQFFEQDCSMPWPLTDGSLDIVFTSNFFEHLPNKSTLARTLREAYRCLKPDGVLIALGPNIRRVPGKYWDFWDHHLCLTELSLGEGMYTVGFGVPTRIASFLPYTMSGTFKYPLWMLRLYLALPILWPVFGHQFLVVGRKPNA